MSLLLFLHCSLHSQMDLPQVPVSPESVTTEWLTAVLSKHVQEPFQITSHKTEIPHKDGQVLSFMAQILATAVNIKYTKDGREETIHLIIKTYPPNTFFQQSLTITNAFGREIHAYTELTRQIKEAQPDPNNALLPAWPKFYDACFAFSAKAVVMEDLRDTGFEITDPVKPLTYDQCILALKELAKFHALTYNAKAKRGDIEQFLWENSTLLPEIFPEFGPFLLLSMKNILKFLESQGKTDLMARVEKYLNTYQDIYGRYKEIIRPHGPITTIIYGDFMNINIMFKYGSNGQAEAAKLIEPHYLIYSQPIQDVAYFIYTATDKEFRDAYLEEMLKVYYEAFTEILKSVGAEIPDGYDFDRMKKEFEEGKELGFLLACHVVPMLWRMKDGSATYEQLNESNFMDLFKTIQDDLVKGENKDLIGRVLGIIEDMADANVI